jgi:hypothetical protein
MSMFTEAGLAAIEEAIAGGYLRVRYDDKEVYYRSLDELLKVRDMIRARLGQGTRTRKYFSTQRDY